MDRPANCIRDLIDYSKLKPGMNGCPCSLCQRERPDVPVVEPRPPRRRWMKTPPVFIVDRKKLAAGDKEQGVPKGGTPLKED